MLEIRHNPTVGEKSVRTSDSQLRVAVIRASVAAGFIGGFAASIIAAERFDVYEYWDDPRANRLWIVLSLGIAFIIGLLIPARPTSGTEVDRKRPYDITRPIVPVFIGEAVAVGGFASMFGRSPGEATFWIIGLVISVCYGVLFSVATLGGVIVRSLVFASWRLVRR